MIAIIGDLDVVGCLTRVKMKTKMRAGEVCRRVVGEEVLIIHRQYRKEKKGRGERNKKTETITTKPNIPTKKGGGVRNKKPET